MKLDIGEVPRRARVQTPPTGSTFSDTVVFSYRVQEGDNDPDGIGISANTLRLNGGAILDRAGNAAGLSHGTVPADPSHKVITAAEY